MMMPFIARAAAKAVILDVRAFMGYLLKVICCRFLTLRTQQGACQLQSRGKFRSDGEVPLMRNDCLGESDH